MFRWHRGKAHDGRWHRPINEGGGRTATNQQHTNQREVEINSINEKKNDQSSMLQKDLPLHQVLLYNKEDKWQRWRGSTLHWESRKMKVSQWKLIPNQKWGVRGSVEMASDSDWYIKIAPYVTRRDKKDRGKDEPVILLINFSWNIFGLGNREKLLKISVVEQQLIYYYCRKFDWAAAPAAYWSRFQWCWSSFLNYVLEWFGRREWGPRQY